MRLKADAMSIRPRVLVVGCGAIGGVTAGHLLERGHDVAVLTTNETIASALRAKGLVLRSPIGSERRVPAPRVLREPGGHSFDYVLLATQPPQVEEAAESVVSQLSERGRLVCFQNGLCEERIARFAGRSRVIGAVVAWGASMRDPGVYERTSAGGFSIGTLEGPADERLGELGTLLSAVGPVTTTTNLTGVRWSKLAINCAISTLGTIGGDRLGVLIQKTFARTLALEMLSEVVTTAEAEHVQLEKVSGTVDLRWLLVHPTSPRWALAAKHALALAVGMRFRKLRSSMLGAIERGRTPAVDFLNGEVITRARKHGIHVTVNATARDFVWSIAQGVRRPGLPALRELYEATRS